MGHKFFAGLDCKSSLVLRAEVFCHVVSILDTVRTRHAVLEHNKYHLHSLRILLEQLNDPYSCLYNARDDATFTLRVLLLSTAKCGQTAVVDGVGKTRLARLEESALTPLPNVRPLKPIVGNEKSKARRVRKSLDVQVGPTDS